MTTVTAKNLRNNLSQYLDILDSGEEVFIIRRSKIIGSLRPVTADALSNGSAVAEMLKASQSFFLTNKNLVKNRLSAKDLYHDAIGEKYNS